jgi:hypothetical protein
MLTPEQARKKSIAQSESLAAARQGEWKNERLGLNPVKDNGNDGIEKARLRVNAATAKEENSINGGNP